MAEDISNLKTQIIGLSKLQDLDYRLDGFEKLIKEIPTQLQELELQLENDKNALEEDNNKLNELEKDRRVKEGNLKGAEEKLKNLGAKIREVKTEKEMYAVEREKSSLKEANAELEEEVLKILEEIDKIKEVIQARVSKISDIEKQIQTQSEELKAKLKHAQVQATKDRETRKGLTPEISDENLKRYEIIKKSRGYSVIVPVINAICQGCHMNIPPQLFNEVLKNSKLHACPNCQRFIYVEDKEELESA